VAEPSLICWADVETAGEDRGGLKGGLDLEVSHVLEVGLVLTGWDLQVLGEASWVLHFNGPVSPLIARMHGPTEAGGSGLLDLARQSPLDAHEVEDQARAWLLERVTPGAPAPVLGGRNAHFDRRFLQRFLPRLEACLSHRALDLSSLWMAFNGWVAPEPRVTSTPHRSLPDLHRDLEQARGYRAQLLQLKEKNDGNGK